MRAPKIGSGLSGSRFRAAGLGVKPRRPAAPVIEPAAPMDALQTTISLLNGLAVGLWLFMLAAGLTLVFSIMGVLNFAHAAFYMLGAYVGYSIAGRLGFGWALLLAPLVVGVLGALFEATLLRRAYRGGHVPELLLTFGASYVLLELVQLGWGRAPLETVPPAWLAGPLLTLVQPAGEVLRLAWGAAPEACAAAGTACMPFGALRAFVMLLALAMLAAIALLLRGTRVGLVVRAARTHPQMVQALGHDVPRVFTGVFAFGTALAALAGVVGGTLRVTEPAMALQVGALVFAVIVIGGVGSLAGAFVAALAIGVIDAFAVGSQATLLDLLRWSGIANALPAAGEVLAGIRMAQVAAVLPYLLLVLVLIVRPQGLLGRRER
mgnify:CR=1 FL=1